MCESDRGVREISQYLLNYRGTAVQNSRYVNVLNEGELINSKGYLTVGTEEPTCTDHSRCTVRVDAVGASIIL